MILLGILRIGISEGVWKNVNLMPPKSPRYPAPQSKLKTLENLHDDCVHVLRVKRRIVKQYYVLGVGKASFRISVK